MLELIFGEYCLSSFRNSIFCVLKDDRSFTAEEENRLQVTFQLNTDEIEAVLDTLSFILEQAAYHSAKPKTLQHQLELIELHPEKVTHNNNNDNNAKFYTGVDASTCNAVINMCPC